MQVGRLFGTVNNKRIIVAAVLVALGLVFTAQPAKASHTTTCEIIDGTRVCAPDIHTPPTISTNNAFVTVNEGRTATNTGTFSDPDGNDTVAFSASVGSVTKDNAAGTWNWSFNTNDGPDQSQTVTITATDGTDTVTTTFSLTVRNVAPTIIWSSFIDSVVETDPQSYLWDGRYRVEVFEPGNDTFTLDIGCGAGGVLVPGTQHYSRSYLFDCAYPDGPASPTVRTSITDSDGASSNTLSRTVSVTNVNPRVDHDLLHPEYLKEGETLTVGAFAWDVPADTSAGFRYAFACNGGPLEGATYANGGDTYSHSCFYDDNVRTTLNIWVTDKDGGTGTTPQNGVVVENVAPTATLTAPASAQQGRNFDLSLTDIIEPSSADRAALSYAFDCGDGLGYVDSTTASKGCTALDQPTMTVKGKVTDKDGGTNEYTKTVSVNNVAPTGTIRINDGSAATKSATVSLALSATDPLPGSGVGHMRLRNENATAWSAWEPFATSRSWLLSEGDGAKTVHVEYRDNAGNISTAAIRDEILLDTIRPTISGMFPRHGSVIRDTTPTIKATAKDNRLLGKTSIKLYVAGKRIPAAKFKYTASSGSLLYNSPKLTKGKKTIRVVATDRAGNVGAKSWSFRIR